MKLIFLLIVASVVAAPFIINQYEEGTKWAVLVAGSNTIVNYRHQADICHAYQILHRNGIPEENIIVMMFDDIANNPLNKKKGYIYNQPNGTDVYQGVIKDYTGYDVTPENFLNVITGNSEAMEGIGSGKVLRSGENDRVFINLVDHGAPGVFAFPSAFLLATELVDALVTMYRNRMYKEMVIYVESCESGSMFSTLLPDDINVYAMTASSPTQPSFACYLDFELHVYLGDLFSVNWMEDTEVENTEVETFQDQYTIVANATKEEQTASVYGERSISADHLSHFIGSHKRAGGQLRRKRKHHFDELKKSADAVPDVPFLSLLSALSTETSVEKKTFYKKELIKLQKNRNFMESKVKEIVLRTTWDLRLAEETVFERKNPKIYDWVCYEATVRTFHELCFNLGMNTHALRFLGIFAALCNHGYTEEKIIASMTSVCDHPTTSGIS